MTRLENQLGEASADSNIVRINELANEYEQVKATLDSLYQEWQELAGRSTAEANATEPAARHTHWRGR